MANCVTNLTCIHCGATYPGTNLATATGAWMVCPRCGPMEGILDIGYDLDRVRAAWKRSPLQDRPRNQWRYEELLPLEPTAIRREWPTSRVRVADLRDDDTVGAEVERALDEERVGARRADQRRRAAVLAGDDRGVERSEVVAAVLGVEDHEVEARRGERADERRRRDQRPDAGERAAGGELRTQRMGGHGLPADGRS